jgi:rubredoxin
MTNPFEPPFVRLRPFAARMKEPANGHTSGTPVRRCPSCGVTGVRYIRSTGRWHRTPSGRSSFGYVTFCAACGYEYGETQAG